MYGLGRYFWIFTALSLFIFLLFPQIDILVTSYFYDGGFYLQDQPIVHFFYKYGPLPAIITGVMSLLFLIINYFRKRELFDVKKVVWLYLLLVLVVGPGLIVNVIFKDNWGRARPKSVEIFGGDKKFTPAFVKTDQCEKNCSFTCGHASAGFFFIALALLAKKRRNLYLTLSIGLGAIIGLGRMVQGGHFLSDVVFSFIFTYMTAQIFYHLLISTKS